MDRAETYRQRAEEAERLAGLAPTDIERASYARIAQGWRELEREEKRREVRGV